MSVKFRDNFIWQRRPLPTAGQFEINRYSDLMVLVLCRACDIAERHSHHVVRVEHLFEAFLAEPDARVRLDELGYADNDDMRRQRFQLLSRPTFAAGAVPADALGQSDALKKWDRVARESAARREPELRTVTVDDFVAAVREDLSFDDTDLRSVQEVLAGYKRLPVLPFRVLVEQRFDQADKNLHSARDLIVARVEDSRNAVLAGVSSVGQAVSAVGQAVKGVSSQVATVQTDIAAIRADSKVLRAQLPRELELSGSLVLISMLLATFGGLCVGLLARGQWGGL